MEQLEVTKEGKPDGYVTWQKNLLGKTELVSNGRHFEIVWVTDESWKVFQMLKLILR